MVPMGASVLHRGSGWFLMSKGHGNSYVCRKVRKEYRYVSFPGKFSLTLWKKTAPDKWLNDVVCAMLKIILLWQGFYGRNKQCWACRGPNSCKNQGVQLHTASCFVWRRKRLRDTYTLEMYADLTTEKGLKMEHRVGLKCVRLWNFWGWLMSPSSKNFLNNNIKVSIQRHQTILLSLQPCAWSCRCKTLLNPVMGRLSFPQTEILFICAKIYT